MAATSSGLSQVSNNNIGSASITDSQDANFVASGINSTPDASRLLTDALDCEYEPQSTDFIALLTPNNDNMADQSQSTVWDSQSQPQSQSYVLQQSDIESLDNQLENLPCSLYVQRLLKLYCRYLYTRPCVINHIWGLKQL